MIHRQVKRNKPIKYTREMKNEELYLKTTDVLLDAFNKKDLEHANCTYCAVGNICIEASKNTGIERDKWSWLFVSLPLNSQVLYPYGESNVVEIAEAKILIKETGYTVNELARIEKAFESAHARDDKENTQIHGLKAVLDVLTEIHQVDEQVHSEKIEAFSEVHERVYA